jgi:trehalose synthase
LRYRTTTIDDYEPLIGPEKVRLLRKKARAVQNLNVVHVNSTYYGGGVAQLLSSLTLLLNSLKIKTGWRVIHGPPDFFSITKKMHNALQGAQINLTDLKIGIYEQVVFENALRNHFDHDLIIVHDPQPLPLIDHYRKHSPWVWVCHIDLTNPNRELWNYLSPFVEKYDAAIFSQRSYRQSVNVPQLFFPPAIDPFSITNKELSEEAIDERLEYYGIPTDLPLVVQISRFDRWKDPDGVIKAFQIARKQTPATLVLLGNVATDDPEGEEVYRSLLAQREERVVILSRQDGALVNALQRRAAVVLQKSLREGFGLTVAEAMWKGTPVIGGNVGGIRSQIQNGENGFLVSSAEEAGARIVQLLEDKELRARMGKMARRTVQENFLMTCYLERYLDLFGAFDLSFSLNDKIKAYI